MHSLNRAWKIYAACILLLLLCSFERHAYGRPTAAELLPIDTVAFAHIPSSTELKERFLDTALGRIGQESQIQPLLQNLLGSGAAFWSNVRGESDLELQQLLSIPQGEVGFGLVVPPEGPLATVLIVDVADQLPVAKKLLDHIAGLLEQQGSGKTEETIEGTLITSYHNIGGRSRQFVYCERENTVIVGSNEAVVHDIVNRWSSGVTGESLQQNERFVAGMNSVNAGGKSAIQLGWFVDPIALVRGATRDNGAAQVGLAILPALGLDGLQALAGSMAFAEGEFDQIMQVHLLLEAPRSGVLDLFDLTPGDMTPEAWVPTDAADYLTVYWDIPSTYRKLETLVDSFQGDGAFAGQVKRLISTRVGVDFETEVLPLLGDRISRLNWIQQPITANSQGSALAVHLSDPSAFSKVLEKAAEHLQGSLEKKSFGATTYYVFTTGNNAADPKLPRPQPCFALIQDCLIVGDRPALLEKIILGPQNSSDSLASALDYKLIANKAQRQTGGRKAGLVRFSRPEEPLRMMYELAVSGSSREDLARAAKNNAFFGAIHKALEENTLPPFEVLAKYLAPGGAVLYNEENGLHYTSFTLRRK